MIYISSGILKRASLCRARPLRFALATLAIPGLIVLGGLGGFRVNLTASEPLGLWKIIPLARPPAVGDIVFICPPDRQDMRQAWERGYVRSGLCPSGYAPLIKTVSAVAGQVVTVSQAVRIDGAPLRRSQLIASDGKGRPLMPFAGGTVPPGSVFLHSSFVGSFDSRYFGPLPIDGILGLAREVLTYDP
jgi:conjugative transfer signal peptidase TraF